MELLLLGAISRITRKLQIHVKGTCKSAIVLLSSSVYQHPLMTLSILLKPASTVLDHQLREQIPHNATEFPITYFHDELTTLPNWTGPLHWHPDFKITTASNGVLDYQVGQQHIILEAGDNIFVNGNMLHGIKPLSGDSPDPMPNIVFSGIVIAPENSTIHKKYIQTIAQCDSLPFIVFRHENSSHSEVNSLIQDAYSHLSEQMQCYEMAVQRNIRRIFEYIFYNFDSFPKSETTRIQIKNQIRFQKMLTYI